MESTRPRSILVVDDEPNVRLTLRFALDGYDVDDAADGETAIARCAARRFDLVLLDLRLPGIDGMDVLARLHATDPHLRVVMITAHGGVSTAVDAMRRGALDFLQKPFTPAGVRAAVARALETAAGPRPAGEECDELLAAAHRDYAAMRLDSAEDAARRALSLEPGRAETLNLLGAIAELRGQPQAASFFYAAASDVEDGYEPARRNAARLQVGSSGAPLLGR